MLSQKLRIAHHRALEGEAILNRAHSVTDNEGDGTLKHHTVDTESYSGSECEQITNQLILVRTGHVLNIMLIALHSTMIIDANVDVEMTEVDGCSDPGIELGADHHKIYDGMQGDAYLDANPEFELWAHYDEDEEIQIWQSMQRRYAEFEEMMESDFDGAKDMNEIWEQRKKK